MARVHYYSFITNDEGQPISQVDVSVLLSGTTTAAKIFNHPSTGVSDNSDPQLTTNKLGYFEFWIGDEDEGSDGYANTQKFKISWEKTGVTSGYIDYIDIFPTIYGVDETSSTSIIKNKTLSDNIAYTWDQHAQYDFSVLSPSAVDVYNTTAHGLDSANFNDSDNIYNKLVSNKFLQDNYVSRDGSQAFTSTVGGITPTLTSHLSTKGYVDTTIGSSILNATVINSIVSNVTPSDRQSTILGSSSCEISGAYNSAIINSGACEIDGVDNTAIIASLGVKSDTQWTLVLGYDPLLSGTSSTAHKTIELRAENGDVWAKRSFILYNNTGFPVTPQTGQIYFESNVLYLYDGSAWITYALDDITITAGDGLSGGGDLSANRTIDIGTPSSITTISTNIASGTTHTHELIAAVTVNKLSVDWTYDAGLGLETVTITHNLNDSYPVVTIWDTTTDEIVYMDNIESVDANNVKLYSSTALNIRVKLIK